MQFSTAKIRVARARGDSNLNNLLPRAGDAIEDAIRTWNTRWWWSFNRRVLAGQVIPAGETDLFIENFATARSVRITSPVLRKLNFFSRNYLVENVTDIDTPGDTESYDEVETDSGRVIRVWPAHTADLTLEVDCFKLIGIPQQDEEELDVPDYFAVGLLDYARYYYLRDFTTEQGRAEQYKRDAELYLARACARDRRAGGMKPRHMAGVESQFPGFVEGDCLT